MQISGFEHLPSDQAGLKMKNFEIYNMQGEKVYGMDDEQWLMVNGNTSVINHQSLIIDISSQPAGVYFLQVKTTAGTTSKKIIIQH